MNEEEKDLHKGHRQRMLRRFIEDGFDNFAEHEVLEVYLFGVIPRANTNPIAHRLIKKFGSLLKVFQAPYEELLEVIGVGERTAEYIKAYLPLMGEFVQQQYTEEKIININSFFTLIDLYITKINDPQVYMLLKDKDEHFIKFAPLADCYLKDCFDADKYILGCYKNAKYCTLVVRDKEKLTEEFLYSLKKILKFNGCELSDAFYKTDFGFQSFFNPDLQFHLYIPMLRLGESINMQEYIKK